jgi:hypothetical protein
MKTTFKMTGCIVEQLQLMPEGGLHIKRLNIMYGAK